MKMVLLLYLEDDAACVDRLLRSLTLPAFSRMPIEGHSAEGVSGWYGEAAPDRSYMAFAMVSDELSGRVLEAVESCQEVEDARHPIRAFQMNIERATACSCSTSSTEDS